MICNFPLLFSHSKNIRMSTLITIIITYYLLIIIIIITKSHNNYCSVGVMELCLLNLLILIDCFLCNSYPCVLFESLSHVINQESHVCWWYLGKIYLVHFLKIWKKSEFQNFKKVNLVNLSQISLLNMWLPVQITRVGVAGLVVTRNIVKHENILKMAHLGSKILHKTENHL